MICIVYNKMSDFFEHSMSSHSREVFSVRTKSLSKFSVYHQFFIHSIEFFRTEHYKFLYMKKSDICV